MPLSKNAYKLIETHGNEFNIISSAYQILYENSNPKTTIEKLTEKLDWVFKLINKPYVIIV